MSDVKDIAFGEIAVHLKFVTQEQVDEALAEQQARNDPSLTLGDILIRKGQLTPERKERVLQHQSGLLKQIKVEDKLRREAKMFAKFAIQKGMVTKAQAETALQLFDMTGDKSLTMAQVMIQQGMLSETQVTEISMARQDIKMICDSCKMRFTVVTVTRKKEVGCPKCGKTLRKASIVERKSPTVAPKPQLLTQVFRVVKKTQQASHTKRLKKVKCPICETEFQGELDKDSRTICVSCGTSFEVM